MIRILHVDMPGDALRGRIEGNLALAAIARIVGIHLVRGTRDPIRQCQGALSRRLSRRSSLPNPDVQGSPVLKRLRDVAASNALDIWSRYQCDRR
jgi:hypothetical protein